MNRRRLAIAAGVFLLVLLVALLWWWRRAEEEGPATTAEEAPTEAGTPAAGTPAAGTPAAGTPDRDLPEVEISVVADLFFPGGGGALHTERREVPARDTVEGQITTLVETLIAGPGDGNLVSPLPREITVRQVYLLDEKVYLDLASPEGVPPPASGSKREMLTVYSLVNTVLLNTEGAEHLVLLWNGRQPLTFAGHLDLARPLAADRRLIAREP